MRGLVDDESRRRQFQAALDRDLRSGRTDSFVRAFEHGYGRPPQALDIRTAEVEPGEQLVYRATFDDGDAVFAEAEALPEEPTP